jgi:2-octaprenyl-6-methoxyphenol hydroxylase
MGALPGLTLLCPATVEALDQSATAARCRVIVEGVAHEVSAALVVVADGAGSKLRDHLGVAASRWEYGQSAVVANVTTERDPDGWAFERFCEEGPVALLPLARGPLSKEMAAIITVPTEEAAALATGDPAAYAGVLAARFGTRLGAFQRVGTRAHYPLALVRAEEQVVGRAVIMGNAAHALHPVAAQGFNLSLRDVAALAEVVANARRERAGPTGGDVGDPAALARYRDWRLGDQREMSLFSDGVARVFSTPLRSVGLARSLGLLAFDLLPPAKRVFAQHMMGLAGRLPRLARGLPLLDPAPLTPSPLGRGSG